MRRRLLSVASKLSMLLFVAAVLMWIASFLAFAPFGQYWGTSWDGNSVHLQRCWVALNGSFHLFRADQTVTPAPTSKPQHFLHSGIDPMPSIRLVPTTFGFALFNHVAHARRGPRVTWTDQQLSFPIWLPAILLGILPGRRIAAVTRDKKRQRRGLCPHCSYNLFGNTSGICPECGTVIPPVSNRVGDSHVRPAFRMASRRRRLFDLLAGGSLLLCLLTAGLGFSNYVFRWHGIWTSLDSDGLGKSDVDASIAGGRWRFTETVGRVDKDGAYAGLYTNDFRTRLLELTPETAVPEWQNASNASWAFASNPEALAGYAARLRLLIFPLWLPPILFVATPTLWLAIHLRRRRKHQRLTRG